MFHLFRHELKQAHELQIAQKKEHKKQNAEEKDKAHKVITDCPDSW
jgi:hypothetical protein